MIFEINKKGLDNFKAYVKTLYNSKDYYIQVISKDKARSINQNNYYWGCVIPAIRYFAKDEYKHYTPDALHKHIKLTLSTLVEEYEKFLCEKKYKDGTIELSTDLSTNFQSMSRKQFNSYLNYLLQYIEIYINFYVGSIDELVIKYCNSTNSQYMEMPK